MTSLTTDSLRSASLLLATGSLICTLAACSSLQPAPLAEKLRLEPPISVSEDVRRRAAETFRTLPRDSAAIQYLRAATIDRNRYILVYETLSSQPR